MKNNRFRNKNTYQILGKDRERLNENLSALYADFSQFNKDEEIEEDLFANEIPLEEKEPETFTESVCSFVEATGLNPFFILTDKELE